MSDGQPTPIGSGEQMRDGRARSYRSAGWWSGVPLLRRAEQHTAERPDARAVRDPRDGWWTRSQLWSMAGDLAEDMTGHGVAAGDVVLICLPNRAAWMVSYLACLRLGAIPAPVPVTTDAASLRHISRLVAARLTIIAPTEGHGAGGALSEAYAALSPLVLVLDEDRGSWHETALAPDASPSPIDGLAQLMFTSSTTGMPKAAAHTEDTLNAVNQAFADRFGITGDRPILMSSPLGHSVGAWHGARLSLFTGAPLVLQERWHPAGALTLVEQEGCAFTAAATPFLKDLVECSWSGDGPKLAPMRTFLCGGAPVPPSLLDAAADQLPRTFISVLWGMTEGGVTTCRPGDPADRVASTAGIGLPGLELVTVTPDGQPQPAGVEGELAMRGPGVFVGYYGQQDLYRAQLTPEGFFRTGDLARLDADGYLHLTGRLKDLIIRGGVNISPIPLENVLSTHPAISHVAVVGSPDERMGERICAVIVPSGQPPTLDELLSWLAERDLPRRQWPERLVVVNDMPRTAAGKIRKPALRQQIEEDSR